MKRPLHVCLCLCMSLALMSGVLHGDEAASDNRIDGGDFEAVRPSRLPPEWQSTDRTGRVGCDDSVAHSGGQSLRLTNSTSTARCIVYTAPPHWTPGRQYELSLFYRSDLTQPLLGAEFSVRVSAMVGDRTWRRWARGTFPATDWQSLRLRFTVPLGAQNPAVTFFFVNAAGSVWIDDVWLEEWSPPTPEPVLVRDGRGYALHQSTLPESPWTPTPKDRDNGYALFVPRSGDAVLPGTTPLPEEVDAACRTFAAPGEFVPLTFALYSLRSLKGVEVESASFTDADGNSLPDTQVTVRQVRVWPQRQPGRDAEYRLVPELLDPPHPTDIGPLDTVQWWVTVQVPFDARPGQYRARFEVHSHNGADGVVWLGIRVLPFPLIDPQTVWAVPAPFDRWTKLPDADVINAMVGMRNHGVNGLMLDPFSTASPLGGDGKVTLDVQSLDRLLRLMSPLGFREPVVIDLTSVLRQLRAAGLTAGQTDSAFRALLQQMAAAAQQHSWPHLTFCIAGTPGATTDAAHWYKLIRETKLGTLGFCREQSIPDDLLQWFDIRCYADAVAAAGSSATDVLRIATQAAGRNFWTFCADGGDSAEGGLAMNRFLDGNLLYRCGATGTVLPPYMEPVGDPRDDFDGGRKDACLVYPGDGKASPEATLQWEGIQQGVDDYRYLHTLTELIRAAAEEKDAQTRERGRDMDAQLHELLGGFPWFPGTGFGNEDAAKARAQLAGWILSMTGNAATAASAATEPPTASVFFTDPPADTAAGELTAPPTLLCPRVASAPVIDGKLDDAVWASAARINSFVAPSGEPAVLPTLAQLAVDARNLYVAVTCTEPRLDQLRKAATQHDSSVENDDCVEFCFDTAHDEKSFFRLAVNAAGMTWAVEQHAGTPETADEWNPSCSVKTGTTAGAWVIEMAIPLTAIGGDASDLWGVNISRHRAASGTDEWSSWSVKDGDRLRPDAYGKVLIQKPAVQLMEMTVGKPLYGASRARLVFANRDVVPRTYRVSMRCEGRNASMREHIEVHSVLASVAPGARASCDFPYMLKAGYDYSATFDITPEAGGASLLHIRYPFHVPPLAVMTPRSTFCFADGNDTIRADVRLAAIRESLPRLGVRVTVSDDAGDAVKREFYPVGGSVGSIAVRPGPLHGPAARLQVVFFEKETGETVWEGEPPLRIVPDFW